MSNPRTLKRERERLLKERAKEKDERRKVRRAERLARGEDPDLASDVLDGGAPGIASEPVDSA
ncbi:MAG: hypothetical protein JXB39_11895 [Deltaproteobacteria bacterium]|nr:hypothetical protein [Deltaproteobacteria bacterium]